MKYTVRNKDGELTYGSMDEVKTAYVIGLIEAEDEVLEEGATLWRKAGGISLLVTARKVNVDRGQSNQQMYWAIGALVLAIFTFYCVVKGYWLLSGLLGFAVVSMMFRVTVLASTRKKR